MFFAFAFLTAHAETQPVVGNQEENKQEAVAQPADVAKDALPADADVDSDIDDEEDEGAGMTPEQMVALQSSLDRNNELLERALTEGIRG